MQGLDNWNASLRAGGQKPVGGAMNTDYVRPVCGEPLLDIVLGELDEWHAVEAKRVGHSFAGAIRWSVRQHGVQTVRWQPSSQKQRHHFQSAELERSGRHDATEPGPNFGIRGIGQT